MLFIENEKFNTVFLEKYLRNIIPNQTKKTKKRLIIE